jgi:hypothetical protein
MNKVVSKRDVTAGVIFKAIHYRLGCPAQEGSSIFLQNLSSTEPTSQIIETYSNGMPMATQI